MVKPIAREVAGERKVHGSNIFTALVLCILLMPIQASAEDLPIPPHAIVVGAWQGQVDKDELEIVIWFETDSKFLSEVNPTLTSGNYIAFAKLKNGGCAEYLHGRVQTINGFGDDYYDIAVAHRGLTFAKRGANKHLFKSCRAMTSLALVVSAESPDTIEFRNLYEYGNKSTLRRVSAPKVLLDKAIAGPPEDAASYVANSKASANQLSVMSDASAGASGKLASMVAEMIPPPPTAPTYRKSAIAVARSSLSNVGNWLGEYEGQEIELSVWFDDDALHQGYVRGYILNRQDQCATGLFGYRAMSQVTTFFSIINDKSLSDYGFEFETRKIDMNGLNTACQPLKFLNAINRLMFVYEPDREEASLATYGEQHKDENGYTNVVRVMSLRRAAVSATMQKIVSANPTIDRERGAQNKPSQLVQQLLDDPAIDAADHLPVDEIPCRVLVRDQEARASLLGIKDIASIREPREKLGIHFSQWSGPFTGALQSDEFKASKQDLYVQVDADTFSAPEFLNLPSDRKGKRFGKEGCFQAKMLDQFLTAIDAGDYGSADKMLAADSAPPKIDNAIGFFFFDKSGIDEVKHLNMARVFGSTTLFVPGDLSREGLWSSASQSMKLRAMVKHSSTSYIEKDLLSKYNEAAFVYDEELSKYTGSDVWVSVEDRRNGNLCVRWRTKHFVDNCIERSTRSMHKSHRYYMTADLNAAKSIFHTISPDASTLSAEESGDPARSCRTGKFCKLTGGIYLNAIYDGSFSRLQVLDKQVRDAGKAAIDKALPNDGLTEVEEKVFRRTEQAQANQFLQNLFTTAFVPTSSLPYLARRYMYQYQNTSRSCFKSGHKVIEKVWIIPPSHTPDTEYNGYLIPGEVIPGSRISASYEVNPEFFALCDRVCDAVKPTGNTMYLTEADRKLSAGIDQLMNDNNCASPEIQQFERNLITLTQEALDQGPQAPYVERSGL